MKEMIFDIDSVMDLIIVRLTKEYSSARNDSPHFARSSTFLSDYPDKLRDHFLRGHSSDIKIFHGIISDAIPQEASW